jgi:hypothetical protein
VLANLEAQPHLFDVEYFCTASILLLLLCPLVIVFTPIDYFSNGRVGVRGNLYEVKILVCRNLQSFCTRENTKLFAFLIDYPELGSLNRCIQAGIFADRLSPRPIFVV